MNGVCLRGCKCTCVCVCLCVPSCVCVSICIQCVWVKGRFVCGVYVECLDTFYVWYTCGMYIVCACVYLYMCIFVYVL